MAGLGFARDQLEKQGWTEGKGLGKEEDGITKAIKVGIKNDTQGVGYKISDQFTFHWWDHVFNKTAKSIVVEENEDGVHVMKDSSSNQPISNKRPTKHSHKPLLYGRFVKASTTTPGDMGSDSDSDVEAEKDFSSGHPEDIVFKACGGRTAHKGARHGLGLNGKLKRIEEQEKKAMSAPCSRSGSPNVTTEHDIEQKTAELLHQLKSKKKEKKRKNDLKSYSDSEGCVVKKTKKRKRNRVEEFELENDVHEEQSSRKRKKNKKISKSDDEVSEEKEESDCCKELGKKKKKNKVGKRKNENMDSKNLDKNKNVKKKGKKNCANSSDDEQGLDIPEESETTKHKGKGKDKIKKDDESTEGKEKRKSKKKKAKNEENTTNIVEETISESEHFSAKKKKKKRDKK